MLFTFYSRPLFKEVSIFFLYFPLLTISTLGLRKMYLISNLISYFVFQVEVQSLLLAEVVGGAQTTAINSCLKTLCQIWKEVSIKQNIVLFSKGAYVLDLLHNAQPSHNFSCTSVEMYTVIPE